MVRGGMRCVKYLLFLFNLLLFLAGLVLIVVGGVVLARLDAYNAFFGESLSKGAVNIVAVGFLIFLIGFFGCCGACKENSCMIYTFAGLLLAILVIEIAAAAVAYVFRDKVHTIVSQQLYNDTVYYNDSRYVVLTMTWDHTQKQFECCGAYGTIDWLMNPALNRTQSVPDSCCKYKNATTGCGAGLANKNTTTTIYTKGCIKSFEDWVNSNMTTIGGVAIGLAFLQVLGVIVACCLGRAIKKEYEIM